LGAKKYWRRSGSACSIRYNPCKRGAVESIAPGTHKGRRKTRPAVAAPTNENDGTGIVDHEERGREATVTYRSSNETMLGGVKVFRRAHECSQRSLRLGWNHKRSSRNDKACCEAPVRATRQPTNGIVIAGGPDRQSTTTAISVHNGAKQGRVRAGLFSFSPCIRFDSTWVVTSCMCYRLPFLTKGALPTRHLGGPRDVLVVLVICR
jgi:hypothetical protein